jgi:hypothetical protein
MQNYTFRLMPGQDLFDSIQAFVMKKRVQSGCVLSLWGRGEPPGSFSLLMGHDGSPLQVTISLKISGILPDFGLYS